MKLAILLNYFLFCKTFILSWSFKVLHPKRSKSSGNFYDKAGSGNPAGGSLPPELYVSTHLASKVSIFWPCHLLLLSLNLSQRCPIWILWEGVKRKKQVDLQRPVQGTYLKKGKSAVSRYFRRSFSCLFVHRMAVLPLPTSLHSQDGLYFLSSQALSPRIVALLEGSRRLLLYHMCNAGLICWHWEAHNGLGLLAGARESGLLLLPEECSFLVPENRVSYSSQRSACQHFTTTVHPNFAPSRNVLQG